MEYPKVLLVRFLEFRNISNSWNRRNIFRLLTHDTHRHEFRLLANAAGRLGRSRFLRSLRSTGH